MTPIIQVELIITSVFYVAAWLLYTPAPWYKSWFGRVLWTLLTTLMVISLLITLGRVGHLAYLLVMGTSILIFVSLLIAQVQGRKVSHERSAFRRAGNPTDSR